jgi:glycosyltransferase involved in cell wall biosynthesis
VYHREREEGQVRVGFDARWYNKSGVGSYVAGLLPALVRAGCELVVYVDPANPVPGLEHCSVKTVAVQSGKYSPLATLEFRGRARNDKLDLFHCPFYAAPLLQCPVIVTIHDLIPFLFPVYPWPKLKMVQAGYRAAASRAAHVIADSCHTARDIQKILKVASNRVSTVYLAADREIFHPASVAREEELLHNKFGIRKPYVVVASAGNWRTKNLKGALEALELAREIAGAEFQTVAYGPTDALEPQNIDELAHKLNLVQTDYLRTPDLAVLFRHAHAFMMPSLYEGFGLPMVEAMSCGCPVITSDRGSLPEVAGDGAQCFDPLEVEGMSDALVALLGSSEELERRKSAALRRAADFSWDKAARETISVYHHVKRLVSAP